MLPKEKFFIGKCFEERLIDTVVGTDALAMGVNYPIENVVFTQLSKYYDGNISKNLFDQLAGRAGRKGYFDEGNVYYCEDFVNDRGYPLEAKGHDTSLLYALYMFKPNEDINIQLIPKIKEILQVKTSIQEEAEYITKFSYPQGNIKKNMSYIKGNIDYIKEEGFEDEVNRILGIGQREEDDYYYDDYGYEEEEEEIDEETRENKQELMKKEQEFKENIAQVYFEEFSPEKNCAIFADILCGIDPNRILDEYANPRNFYDMLQFRKYVKSLPKQYKRGLTKVEDMIREVDDMAIDEYRGSVSTNEISKRLKKENRLNAKNIMQVLEDQKMAMKMNEKADILEEQLRIAEEYGLEDY